MKESTELKLEKKRQALMEKQIKLEDKLYEAEKKETELIARRGWGYGMRHSKIGFSTRISDNIKERLKKCENELSNINKQITKQVKPR